LNDFFGARYYTAPLMRFLTPDPANLNAVDPTDPQTWNQYAYVRNNPLNSIDPSGSCDVLVNGATQGPGEWAPIDEFGANMINSFPFAERAFYRARIPYYLDMQAAARHTGHW
jgi:hypothetical protein